MAAITYTHANPSNVGGESFTLLTAEATRDYSWIQNCSGVPLWVNWKGDTAGINIGQRLGPYEGAFDPGQTQWITGGANSHQTAITGWFQRLHPGDLTLYRAYYYEVTA